MKVYAYDESEIDWVPIVNSLSSTFEATTLAREGALAISNDGNVLAIGAPSHENCLSCRGLVSSYEYISLSNEWRRRKAISQTEPGYTKFGANIALSSDGKIIAISEENYYDRLLGKVGKVRVYNWQGYLGLYIKMGRDIAGKKLNEKVGSSLTISNDGSLVAVGLNSFVYKFDSSIDDWKTYGQNVASLANTAKKYHKLFLSGNGRRLIITSNSGHHAQVFEINERAVLWKYTGKIICFSDMNVSDKITLNEDGSVIVVAGKIIRIYDWESDLADWIQNESKIDDIRPRWKYQVSSSSQKLVIDYNTKTSIFDYGKVCTCRYLLQF